MKAFIKYISEYYPKKSYTNDDFFREFPNVLPQKDNLLKVGVKNRYIIDKDKTSSDIAVESAKKLFKEHNVSPKDIDFLIFCSGEFDYTTPTSSALIQDRLGVSTKSGTVDILSSCTGFVQSLALAKGMIESNQMNNVLIICVSSISKEFHDKDFNSKFLFGDAATAILVSSQEKKSIGKFVFGTDGGRADYIIIRDGGSRNPINEKSFDEIAYESGSITSRANFFMNGTGIFLFGIKTVPKLIDDILKENNLEKSQIDYFVFHQANVFLLETLKKKISIPDDKFIIHMENTGNTVACTIPIAYNHFVKTKQPKKGSKILIAAFGTGLTWGGTVIEY